MSTNHQKKISRRNLVRAGALAGLGAAISSKASAAKGSGSTGTFQSPALRPFVQPLPRQSHPAPMTLDPAYPAFDCYNRKVTEKDADRASRPVGELWHQLGLDASGNPYPKSYYEAPNLKIYEMSIRNFRHLYHPDLAKLKGANPAGAWMFGYGLKGQSPTFPGPMFKSTYGSPTLIRVHNDLTEKLPDGTTRAFGSTETSMHLHNFHTASESDGNPLDPLFPGEYRDHLYNLYPAGHDPREVQNTLWYHDHCLDFTSQNVYRGLVGFHLLFDERDSGDETDTNSNAFRLPSGEFDIPMVFTDPAFLPNGELFVDLLNFDGILGDRFAVNGAVQPYSDIKPRKYRFRFLDGGPSRWYHLALTDGTKILPYSVIANDGNLLEAPVTMDGVTIGVAERIDMVFDFKPYAGKTLYLINRMEQKDGRGPTGKILSIAESTKLVELRVSNKPVSDPSQLPSRLRPQPTIDLSEVVVRRKFSFGRTNGAWSVNNTFFDGNTVSAAPKRGTAEIWELESGGGWAHPVHVHFEEGRILTRNGKTPPPHERGRKDVYPLIGSEKVEVFIRFRDYVGKYVTHCHNTVHEDHAMMFRWDIVKSAV